MTGDGGVTVVIQVVYLKKKLFVHAKQSLVLTENVLITTGSYLRGFAFLVQSAGTKFRGIAIP